MTLDEKDQYMDKQENQEQSRILWIVLSALSVFAIAIAVGIFFFFPTSDGEAGQLRLSSLSPELGRDIDHVEYINSDGYPELIEPEAAVSEFTVDTAGEMAVDTAGEIETPAVEKQVSVPETREEEINVIEVVAPVSTPVRTAVPVTPKEIPAVTEVKKQETMKISVTVYWIQVGSYNDLIKAEDVRDYLLSTDISSEIQTKAVDGKTYYRVRIGAFQSKGEADRFLKPIKDMKNFEDSYVSQTTMRKEVPVN